MNPDRSSSRVAIPLLGSALAASSAKAQSIASFAATDATQGLTSFLGLGAGGSSGGGGAGGGGGASGGIQISTDADSLVWFALVAVAVAFAVGEQRTMRSACAVLGGALLVLLGVPLHVAGAGVLLAVVAVARPSAAPLLAVAGALAVASVPEVVAGALARADAVIVAAILPWLGVATQLDGTVVAVGADSIVVDPACAAVEGIVVAFAASIAVRALIDVPLRRALLLAAVHAGTFAVVNVLRIAAVGAALRVSPAAAELVHALGGPLLAVVVHVPFLVGPVRTLAAKARASESRAPSLNLTPAAGAV